PLPRPLAEQRHEALREQPALGDAARTLDVGERLRPRVDAREPARHVGLDRGGEIRWPLEPNRPRPVAAPPRGELVRYPPVELRRAEVEVVVPEEMLRRHRHVRLEL